MSILSTATKSVSALYDFNDDPSNGAIGVVKMGPIIPAKSIIWGCYIFTQIGFNSAGLATVAFGLFDMDGSNTNNATALIAANAFGVYVPGTVQMNIPLANAFHVENGVEVQMSMTIGVAAITRGRVWVTCFYNEQTV